MAIDCLTLGFYRPNDFLPVRQTRRTCDRVKYTRPHRAPGSGEGLYWTI